ncbi:beta-lactamase [Arthrobacter sp. ERGS1:01]|uniref:DUF6623 family protein n=1 Tax=Arthrobacter sp. ERGS1:01 TaxID=1704044 RepID=UPI0006B3F988|nr:DUF6623 family protein [Arthrobacter sp. ERGS1:01]ALE06347.1 beta-lactamase [Arthrobacter sp. ERGS1:01]
MSLYASWVHGNAVTVESPENLTRVGHYGWGGDMAFIPGKASWLHIPLPTPVIVGDQRSTVQKLFLMFMTDSCSIRQVHFYDGSSKIEELNNLNLAGEHRSSLDAQNTFHLSSPHTVVWGLGITFFVQADIGFDSNISTRLIVASAGGDFNA